MLPNLYQMLLRAYPSRLLPSHCGRHSADNPTSSGNLNAYQVARNRFRTYLKKWRERLQKVTPAELDSKSGAKDAIIDNLGKQA